MSERLGNSIVRTLEKGIVPSDLLDLVPKQYEDGIRREEFVLGHRAALDRIFKIIDEEGKAKFRDGLVDAIKKTKTEHAETLGSLVFLACDTRAYGAIPFAVRHVDKIKSLNEENRNVLGGSIGLLVVYGELNEETKNSSLETLHKWFKDERFKRFTASLLNAICTLDSDEFPKIFPRFIEVSRKHPDYFCAGACAREFIRVVTPEKMNCMLSELPEEGKELIQKFL